MDWLWITLGIILILAGIAGSLLPLLPGPPIAYVGLFIQIFREPDPFTSRFLWIWAGIVVVSLILDYLIPMWGTKKVWRYKVWRMGMYHWFLAGILDGTLGGDHRSIHWRLCGRNDCWAGFEKIIQGGVGFLRWFYNGFVFKIGYLLYDALPCYQNDLSKFR